MRRLVGAALLVGGPLLFLRRRAARGEHVDLFFDDGSSVTLRAGTPAADAILAAARPAV